MDSVEIQDENAFGNIESLTIFEEGIEEQDLDVGKTQHLVCIGEDGVARIIGAVPVKIDYKGDSVSDTSVVQGDVIETVEKSNGNQNEEILGHLFIVDNRINIVPQSTVTGGESEESSVKEVSSEDIACCILVEQKEKAKKKAKSYHCLEPGCDRSYSSPHHLKVHTRKHQGVRPYSCMIDGCEKSFSTLYSCKAHMRTHTGEKPYKCKLGLCSKSFKTSGDLQKHTRIHTGERPFVCPVEWCGKAFTTSNIRQVHIRSHTGERPFVCDKEGCGRKFASSTNYKNHMRIHSGEKPFVCSVEGCEKRFTEYSSLYKHQAVHNKKKYFSCFCGKSYRRISTLTTHHKTAHGIISADGSEIVVSSAESSESVKNIGKLNLKKGTVITIGGTEEEGSSPLYILNNDLLSGIGFDDCDFETYELNDSLE